MEQLIGSPITALLIAANLYFSVQAFNNYSIKEKMLFRPAIMGDTNQWYRFISSGFIHADWMHLAFNMLALLSFGSYVEQVFEIEFSGGLGSLVYLALYFACKVLSSTPTYFKQKHNYAYAALGASGAVSGIVYASILLNPLGQIGMIFLPGIYFPAWIFGFVYLAFSSYMAKKQIDNIGHDAHFWGAVSGFVLTGLLNPDFFVIFFNKITGNG